MEGASSYAIWLVNLADGTLVTSVTGITSNAYAMSVDLTASKYRLLVRASNAVGSSSWSAPFDFDVGTPITRPAAPVITGTSGDPLAPQVNWNASTGATSYMTWLVDLTSGTLVSSVQVPGASFTPDSDLAAGRYRILVRAVNSAGLSPWSAPLDFSVNSPTTAPQVPLALSAIGSDTPRPTLQWPAVEGASSYAIWLVNLADGTLVTSVTGITSNAYTLPVDLSGGNYRFLVRASNAVGSSRWSAPHDFTVSLASPLSLLAGGDWEDDDDDEQQSLAAVDAAILLLVN